MSKSAAHPPKSLHPDPVAPINQAARAQQVRTLFRQGSISLSKGDTRGALKMLSRACMLAPQEPRIQCNLGLALQAIGDHEKAIQCLQSAIQIDPSYELARANLASVLETCNRNDEAKAHAIKVLEINPKNTLALLVLAELERRENKLESAHIRLNTLLTECGSLRPEFRAWTLLERGMVRDKLGRCSEAFADFVEGKQILFRLPNVAAIDHDRFPKLLAMVHQTMPALHVDRWPIKPPSSTSRTPIFLVGFPRSGTTLAEQIIGCHSHIQGTDEAPLLPNTIGAMTQLTGKPYDPARLTELSDEQIRRLRTFYWAQADQLVEPSPTDAGMLLDKLPLNMVHLPFIRRVFPDAKIIVALRDPRDCCLSTLMQRFKPDEAMVHFHHLASSANIYSQVMRIWLHARHWPGLQHFTLRYESLVTEPESLLRALCQFLELDWEPALLNHQRSAHGKRISTPSHQDVATPIFTRAVRRWEGYQSEMAPILPILQPFVDAFEYR